MKYEVHVALNAYDVAREFLNLDAVDQASFFSYIADYFDAAQVIELSKCLREVRKPSRIDSMFRAFSAELPGGSDKGGGT